MEQPAEQRLELTDMAVTLGLARTARAMATDCTITVVGHDPAVLIERGMDRVAHLEHLWSRFRDDSEISRLNGANGTPTPVSHETQMLVSMMKAAHAATRGAYNPTLLPLQLSSGDTTSLDGHPIPPISANARVWDTLDDLVVFDDGTVGLPPTMTLDPGGIGKGLAADIVAGELVDAGADAACVNIGGDLRIARRPSCEHSWPVTICSPRDVTITDERLSLLDGAVATSDRAARRRPDGTTQRHHFSPDSRDLEVLGATVIASSAAWAEAWTKHAMTRPVDSTLEILEQHGLAGRIVLSDGTVRRTSTWQRFLA